MALIVRGISRVSVYSIDQSPSKRQEVGFTPLPKVREKKKVFVAFWDFLGAKNVDPEEYISCGSYELLVGNVAHQMYEKY